MLPDLDSGSAKRDQDGQMFRSPFLVLLLVVARMVRHARLYSMSISACSILLAV
jgi:hypothetical protein